MVIKLSVDNNDLSDIHEEAFRNLSNLEYLDLHQNMLLVVPKASLKLPKLKKLHLSDNRIREISASSIPNQIETLMLRHNKISKIKAFTFVAKRNLTLVDLRNNNVSNLQKNSLLLNSIYSTMPLPNFYISDNPYLCDYDMQWLQLQNRINVTGQYPNIVDLDAVTCKQRFPNKTSHIARINATSSNFLYQYTTHCFALCNCCEFDDCGCEMICPENCSCYHDESWSKNIVDCSAKGIASIPRILPYGVSELYLDGNLITI
ncbi:Protein toll-like protein [Leptotrombidium deliense]|uniref:Protein toll-like protein n=1 Tax=Leptotrombidium deliense TaxID=299467 RepID=A0A443S1T0_9ACAR|nr:Protein toll-like protein [Leptotrombidium deliense]